MEKAPLYQSNTIIGLDGMMQPDPALTVSEALELGTDGLGSLIGPDGTVLDGEVTFIDGRAYYSGVDGQTRALEPDEKLCFFQIFDFNAAPKQTFKLDLKNREEWEKFITTMYPDRCVGIRVKGMFKAMETRSVQGKAEHKSLSDVVNDQIQFDHCEYSAFEGAAIFTPDRFSPEDEFAGLHMHAIEVKDGTLKSGAHVLNFEDGYGIEIEVVVLDDPLIITPGIGKQIRNTPHTARPAVTKDAHDGLERIHP